MSIRRLVVVALCFALIAVLTIEVTRSVMGYVLHPVTSVFAKNIPVLARNIYVPNNQNPKKDVELNTRAELIAIFAIEQMKEGQVASSQEVKDLDDVRKRDLWNNYFCVKREGTIVTILSFGESTPP